MALQPWNILIKSLHGSTVSHGDQETLAVLSTELPNTKMQSTFLAPVDIFTFIWSINVLYWIGKYLNSDFHYQKLHLT